ncbi:MAG: VWA domain-containing protein [Ruminococcaceae bacterium]|nr:VWA domain-containing protein [Oscillospiraceae bacterium]
MSVEKTFSDGLVDTYTIIFTDGTTTTFTITNGEQGIQGDKGEPGVAGNGIEKTEIDENGYLVIYYTNDPEIPVVVGKVTDDYRDPTAEFSVVMIDIVDGNKAVISFANGIEFVFEITLDQLVTDIEVGQDGAIYVTYSSGVKNNVGVLSGIRIDQNARLILKMADETTFVAGTIVGSIGYEPSHNWGEWVTIIAPECKPGLRARECLDCGETKVDLVDAEHDYIEYVAKNPTCTSIGWNAYHICTVCGASDYVQIPALGHDKQWVVTVEPSCTEAGAKVYKCTRCEMVFDRIVIEALGHESDGEKCVRCGLYEFDLTIHYVYSDGSSAASDYSATIWEGTSYSIVSPEIEGRIADLPIVSGVADSDKDITVTYSVITIQTIVRIDPVALGNIEYNTPYSSLGLPENVTGYTEAGVAISLKVYWNAATYNPTAYGEQTVEGVAVAGYGYIIGCSNSVCASLNITNNVIVSIDPMDLGRLPLNTTYDGLGLPTTAAVTVSTGSVYYVPVTWNSYDYDPAVVGTHTITGTITLEDGFSLAEGVENIAVITFELSEAMYGTADIVFLVDTTGSMWGEIQNVKNNIATFAESLEDAGVSVRWALLEYRDITCDGYDSTKIIYCGASEWYINVASYEKALESLRVNGGGDREETVIDALKAATYLDSRDGANTFYIVVTDADYKTNNRYGISGMNDMINELVSNDTVTSVVTKPTYYDVYRNLTDRTKGILANIDGDFARELWRLTDLITEEVIYGNVVRIEIVSDPTKVNYIAGDYFDGNGMIVRAHYSSGLSRDITGYSVDPYSALQVTDTYVEINYRGKTAMVPIHVSAPEITVDSVILSQTAIELTVGSSATLIATVYPTNAVNTGVVWSTLNPNVAIVNNGVISAVGAGETQIVVTTLEGAHTATVTVVVKPIPVSVEGIYTNVGALELDVGESATVIATVLPSNATDKSVIWTSSNSSVAVVENGVITGVSGGTATITVSTTDGGFTARIFVEVLAETGSISGRVYQSGTSNLLSGVTVKLMKDGEIVDEITTTSGIYTFTDIRYGSYTIVYSKSGYISADRIYTVNDEYDQIDNTYLALDSSRLPGYVSGYAQDATTAYGISGIRIYVRKGAGNTTGTVIQTLTTGSNGYYITNGLEPGNYTLQFVDESSSSTRYNTVSINVTVTGNTTTTNQNVAMAKPMNAGTFKVVITWGSYPSDLDSHLKIDTPSSDYHVSYSNKRPSGAGANLDVDDTSAYGPETITVTSVKSNTIYTYYIHNFSGQSNGIQNSNATVKLYIGSEVYTFNAPNGSGVYWNVFSYNSATGEVTVNNTIVRSAP